LFRPSGLRNNLLLKTLIDKTVLITGGGRGIGKRLALGFAAEGARIALLARSKAELDLARLEIEHSGGNVLRIRADVRDYEQVSAATDRIRVHFGPVQILIVAAGVQGPIGQLSGSSGGEWREPVEVNVLGAINACRAVLPSMEERRAGKIIVLVGRGGMGPRPYLAAYAASQAALVRFVESLAEEIRDHNIQVNCMDPGQTYTHMTDQILSAGERAGRRDREDAMQVRLTGGVPAGKQLQLALFLASERSNHVSGKLIQVTDDWKRLEEVHINPEAFTLRRVQRF
jgi:NAD(P)-dependent dehydrogenase (short-subunit alcohol dehydrogenase family)